jgi:hypothetical protein
MLAAADLHLALGAPPGCAKLRHAEGEPCIHCGASDAPACSADPLTANPREAHP